MPASVSEVREVILSGFPGANVGGVKEENHRIIGVIQWEGFKNVGIDERNRWVTERVRNKLGLKGLNVGILYPLAPGEHL